MKKSIIVKQWEVRSYKTRSKKSDFGFCVVNAKTRKDAMTFALHGVVAKRKGEEGIVNREFWVSRAINMSATPISQLEMMGVYNEHSEIDNGSP